MATMLVCEMAAYLKKQGITVLEALEQMYADYGYYLAQVKSVELTGADAMEKAAKMMADMRANAPKAIGGAEVPVVNDYLARTSTCIACGVVKPIALPKSNVLEFVLGDKGSVIVRPSGTEPKVKFYFTAVGETREDAKSLLAAMVAQLS